MSRTRIKAEKALKSYTRRNARQLLTAALGNISGTVEVSGRAGWVWVRLHSDQNQTVQAWNPTSVPLTANIVVDVEIVKKQGKPYYQIVGRSAAIAYPNDPWNNAVGEHASQHEWGDLGTAGFDPVSVYTRAMVNLRARPQATPDNTLYVEVGFYEDEDGNLKLWAGGNSGAFSIPAFGARRCDLLYLDSSDTLQILQGTSTLDGSIPTRPTASANTLPIVFVYLTGTTTAITEDCLRDARFTFQFLKASMTPTAHDILSASHGDTLAAAAVAGDVIIGNATPKWARLAISVPAANVRNVLGVDNGNTLPNWKTALDATAPTTIAEGATAAAGTSLVFSHRDHTHGMPQIVANNDQVVCHNDEVVYI